MLFNLVHLPFRAKIGRTRSRNAGGGELREGRRKREGRRGFRTGDGGAAPRLLGRGMS